MRFAGLALAFFTLPLPALAGGVAILDAAARRAELAQPAFAKAREACLAPAIALPASFPEPIASLTTTEGYGSDNRAQPYAWYVMVTAGRALAGDTASEAALKKALLSWARTEALHKTKSVHDAYYAIKRFLLPVIAAHSIVADRFTPEERASVEKWIGVLVRRMDKKFDGDVDINNHRYLADSVLMAWGAFTGDDALYRKGGERYRIALGQAQEDGLLPLEARRGARAMWYVRHALTSLTVMAETARLKGDDLYGLSVGGKTIDDILSHMVNGVRNELVAIPAASENVIPGPSNDYLHPEEGMLHVRGNGRNYMGFTEAYLRFHGDNFPARRLALLMEETSFRERPLIDEYAGGNATCFWWKP